MGPARLSYPVGVADVVLLTPDPADPSAASVLPGLALLPHRVTILGPDPGVLLSRTADLILVDATRDLVLARGTLRTLAAMDLGCPVVGVLSEGGLGVVDEQWPMDELVLTVTGPAELAARLRLVLARGPRSAPLPRPAVVEPSTIRVADVVVDEGSWTVRAGGRTLDLTYKEFELLRYLVQHPGRVVTRETLLKEVWGSDYYGGTRTVDVHIRRLRAKLGSERESLIGTIRGVGYRFDGPRGAER